MFAEDGKPDWPVFVGIYAIDGAENRTEICIVRRRNILSPFEFMQIWECGPAYAYDISFAYE